MDIINITDGIELYGLIGFLPEEAITKNIYRGGDYFGFDHLIQTRIEYLLSSWMYANRDKNSSVKQPEMLLPEFVKVDDPDIKHISDLSYSELEDMIGDTKERLSKKKRIVKEEKVDDSVNHSSPMRKFKAEENSEFITYKKPKNSKIINFEGGEFT